MIYLLLCIVSSVILLTIVTIYMKKQHKKDKKYPLFSTWVTNNVKTEGEAHVIVGAITIMLVTPVILLGGIAALCMYPIYLGIKSLVKRIEQ